MTNEEAWETLKYYAYKCDNDEYAANCDEQEVYDEAVATMKALVEANK